MTQPFPETPTSTGALNAVETALDKSHAVMARVEACADDLASANDLVKGRIAGGESTMPATQALQESVAVEIKVQAFAEDLGEVTDNLTHGVGEVKEVERALVRSREALAESEAALARSIQAEQSATWRAMHDQKTGLPNRALFDDRLAQAIAGAQRHHWTLAVLFLDLDHFKEINDTHGHAAGDVVLNVVAQRLLRHARSEDTVCRNGGDEFLYLLINPSGRENVQRIAGLVRSMTMEPIGIGTLQLVVTPSIGVALYPDHGQASEMLVAHADSAMYRCKQTGSGCEFFDAPWT